METATATAVHQTALVLTDPVKVKGELVLVDPKTIRADQNADLELANKAEEYADKLLNFNPADFDAQESAKSATESMGLGLQRQAAYQSKMLQEPIHKLSQRGADGGEVANALVSLKMQVEELDPSHLNFEAGWATRLLGHLPLVGTPIERYFSQYESSQTIIDVIVNSLQHGQEQLKRDNIILSSDQVKMRELTFKLEQAVKLGQLLDEKLQEKAASMNPDEPKFKFTQEELLFPLRQRIIDLQQQLTVNQQGVLAMEVVVRNNKELIRGVDRALNVTVSALQVAVAVALALANQKIVLDKITALNTTTSDLIRGTSARLKTQGVEIHKQASSSMLDMESLKASFADLRSALDDISQYRVKALDTMATTIGDLQKMTTEGEAAISKMEKGNRVRPSIAIEVQ